MSPVKDPMWSDLFLEVAGNVNTTHRKNCHLVLLKDKKDDEGRWYFQIHCRRPDAYTGEMGWGQGGKAYLSPHANESELVRTAFGLFKAYEEHEVREGFKYKGKAIFGPHISVDALLEIADRLDFREEVTDGQDQGQAQRVAGEAGSQPAQAREDVREGVEEVPEEDREGAAASR